MDLPHAAPASRAPASLGLSRCPKGFVAIDGGSFVMGNPPSDTGWSTGRARVRSFCLSRTEVTAAEYRACVTAGRCTAESVRCGDAATYDRPDEADHPINCVDWAEASAYCSFRGARLPTEEEWSWAARNGDRATTYPWGNDESATAECFSGATRRTATCPVGSFSPSPLAVYDLGGNVAEWTSTRSSTDETLVATLGGSYLASLPFVRSAGRYFSDATARDTSVGFRCAL